MWRPGRAPNLLLSDLPLPPPQPLVQPPHPIVITMNIPIITTSTRHLKWSIPSQLFGRPVTGGDPSIPCAIIITTTTTPIKIITDKTAITKTCTRPKIRSPDLRLSIPVAQKRVPTISNCSWPGFCRWDCWCPLNSGWWLRLPLCCYCSIRLLFGVCLHAETTYYSTITSIRFHFRIANLLLYTYSTYWTWPIHILIIYYYYYYYYYI